MSGRRTEIRELATQIAKDCIVTDALARFIEQAIEAAHEGWHVNSMSLALRNTRSLAAIHLVREGNYAVVKIEHNDEWIELIREHIDGPFSHIIEPSGIDAAIERAAAA